MRANRFLAWAAMAFAIGGIVALFFDYRLSLLAFGAAAMFGGYVWLLRRKYGPGIMDARAERPPDLHIGWMRTIGWLLPVGGIILMINGNTGWGIVVFLVAFVFLIGSMVFSPRLRQAMTDQVEASESKYAEEQRQKEDRQGL